MQLDLILINLQIFSLKEQVAIPFAQTTMFNQGSLTAANSDFARTPLVRSVEITKKKSSNDIFVR